MLRPIVPSCASERTGNRIAKRYFCPALLVLVSCASAQATTIDAVNRGFQYGGVSTLDWYSVGEGVAGKGGEFGVPNWFAFDLTSVTNGITAATLHLFNPANGYLSSNSSETYAVYEVTSSNYPGGLPMPIGAIGTQVGSVVATAASNGTFLDVALNQTGLDYLNARLGTIVLFSGRITTLNDGRPNTQMLFNFTGRTPLSNTQLLLTTVPIPPAIWLFGSALGAMGWMRRTGVRGKA